MKLIVSTLTLALATSAAFADKLEPLPDNGFVTDVHKVQVGKIVFAKTTLAVTTPEKPDQFADKFALSDEIWLRAYLPHSLQNAFRADGVECVRDDAFRVWDITVDGQAVTDNHLFQEPAGATLPIYNKATSIRFDKALNAKADLEERSLWRQFGDLVVPKLTAGKHTVTLSVSGICTAKAPDYPRVTLSAPMASGTFELTVSDKALAGAAALGTQLPKAAMKNAKLEKEMLAIMKQQWAQDTIYRVIIVDKDWTVRRFDETRVLRDRTIGTMVSAKQGDGKCRLFPVTFAQESLDGSKKWGATSWGGSGNPADISCDKAK